MAAPSTPTNVYLQQGNGDAYLLWDAMSTATSYKVQRSTDNITFSLLASPVPNEYLDTSVTAGTLYYYKVAATNGDGDSAYSAVQSIVPTQTSVLTLSQVRAAAQQRSDMVNSSFVSLPEWNSYINQSYFELYDLLVTLYEDYFLADPFYITLNGSDSYTLPNGVAVDGISGVAARPFYKLTGVDLGLTGQTNAWVTLKKFNFIGRNRFVYPQLTTTYLGVFNLRYRVLGDKLHFIPTPSSGQYVRVWYIPKLTQLLKESDQLDGISGWTEYVIVDAAIKAMQKEESDCSLLMGQKQALIKRIEETGMNRDAGQPDTISDSRRMSELWGSYGTPNGDGGYGGY